MKKLFIALILVIVLVFAVKSVDVDDDYEDYRDDVFMEEDHDDFEDEVEDYDDEEEEDDEDEEDAEVLDFDNEASLDKEDEEYEVTVLSKCQYNCPSGYRKVTNTAWKASANGCGPQGGFSINGLVPEFVSCCNTHDYCYGRCGADRDTCDANFNSCMKKACDKKSGASKTTCNAKRSVLYNSVRAAGCPIFKNAQSKACKCVK